MTSYIGKELELFREARNWKSYLRSVIGPYLTGRVAEIGAGIGSTAEALADAPAVSHWLCAEPDADQIRQIETLQEARRLPGHVVSQRGTVAELPAEPSFEAVLYVDVLEHIEDDRRELMEAAARTVSGGRIIVIGPAWQFLYGPFDKAIGHYRRYTTAMYRHIAPPGVTTERLFYLDSAGILASLAN